MNPCGRASQSFARNIEKEKIENMTTSRFTTSEMRAAAVAVTGSVNHQLGEERNILSHCHLYTLSTAVPHFDRGQHLLDRVEELQVYSKFRYMKRK
ncbi:hypothetical protein CHS0354_004459 [Potamilus streckersoni]|uniref:Uncharacterized protein n=1 Tax=Potamilus streckersoni TaxID=2493646 RepID=A0AAE0SPA3_9BIVA|nr:hypothetical protein CHS0354_004459 [Potamilus streckersoni]